MFLKTFLFALLVFSSFAALLAQDSWHFYKEPPNNVVPIEIVSDDAGVRYMMTQNKLVFYQFPDEEWIEMPGVFSFYNSHTIAVNPSTQRFFLGTGINGIMYTDDLGQNWNQHEFWTGINTGYHAGVDHISFSPSYEKVLLGGMFNPDDLTMNVARSNNGGNSFSLIQVCDNFCDGIQNAFWLSETELIGSKFAEGLYHSTNSGNDWSPLSMDGHFLTEFVRDNEGAIYAVSIENTLETVKGVYVSEDNGVSWQLLDNGAIQGAITDLAYDPISDMLYCSGDQGLFELASNNSWLAANFPLDAYSLNDINFDGVILMSASSISGCMFRTPDSGTWLNNNAGFEGEISDFLFQDNALVSSYAWGPNLSIATAQEQDWTNYQFPFEPSNPNYLKRLEKNGDGRITIFDFDEIQRFDPSDFSFEEISVDGIPTPPTASYFSLKDARQFGNKLLALTSNGTDIYESSDDGQTWNSLFSLGEDNGFLSSELCVDANGRYIIYLVTLMENPIRVITSEDGENWEPIFETSNSLFATERPVLIPTADGTTYLILPSRLFLLDPSMLSMEEISVPWDTNDPNTTLDMLVHSSGDLYVTIYPTSGTFETAGVYKSSDNGTTWEDLSSPFDDPNVHVEVLKEGPNATLFASVKTPDGQNDGIYYYGEEGAFLNVAENGLVSPIVKLYPNPSNGEGLIHLENPLFDITSSFELIDSRGRIVGAPLYRDSGIIAFTPENLASGVYHIKWQTKSGITGSERFILAR